MVLCALPLVTLTVLRLAGVEVDDPRVEQGIVRTPDVLSVLLAVVVVAPVAVRRRFPLQASVVGLAGYLVLVALAYPEVGSLGGALVLAHTLGCHVDPDRRKPWTIALLLAGILGVAATLRTFDFNALLLLVAYSRGASLRSKRSYLGELERRVATADALAEEQARQAVLDERTRIARELHDVVAHGMSVMVVQAGAASRVLAEHPDQAAEAIVAIERTGRESLGEMRRLLGVLREPGDEEGDADGAGLSPQPGIAELETLVDTFRETDLEVHLDVTLDEELTTGLQLSVYRIVQEALTNALRHAGPARASVAVSRIGDVVEVRVDDDGRGASATSDGPGHGLAGMRERAALYGGSVDAGARVGGGFSVVAHLPVGAHALGHDAVATP